MFVSMNNNHIFNPTKAICWSSQAIINQRKNSTQKNGKLSLKNENENATCVVHEVPDDLQKALTSSMR